MLCMCSLASLSDCQLNSTSYRMFEVNMDEYLDEEVEYLKLVFDNICKNWERQVPITCSFQYISINYH